jgi:hypothetical protein
MRTKFENYQNTKPISNLIFHPLGILGVSLAAGGLFVLYVAYRTDGIVQSWLIFYFMPVGVVFVSFILDRIKELGQISVQWLGLDLIVVLLSLARAVTYIPFYSGHALFLAYALLSSQLKVVKILAAIVLLQVAYLKLIRWSDWVTLFVGVLVGSLTGYYRTIRINQKLRQ